MFESQNGGSPRGGRRMLDGGMSRRSLMKFFGLGTAALGSASLLTACGGGGAASAGEARKFAIAAFPGDAYFLDAANLANKDYARHQLEVPKHLNPQSGVQAFQLLVAGAVDAYAADTLLLMATHANSSKGKRPLLVGFRTLETTYGIVGSKDLSWPGPEASFEEKIRSLKGKRIGVSSVGSGGDLQLKLALELAGMKYGDVTALAVGPTAQAIPNLNADRIDAYVTVQWTSTRFVAQETGGTILIDFAEENVPEIMRNQAVVGIGVREDKVEKQPEVVKNWLAAQDDASKWIIENKAAAAELLNTSSLGGKAPQIAQEYVEHYATQVAPKLKPMFKAPRETIEHMAELALRFGSVKKGDITYETLVPEFARA
ncbi:ABC transporter substrate-binding protein [Arthrobacter sp. I2-34]|uniref:ABC transporter substrate-binding protein n=1 Tax=Arthrobacter hankyongi TaxID=2904801 RepID=A0ABS9L8W1_9MICC|nr:ABC transporter substrate-binding protein [Arthrobacter hankyongi]MCG2623109.1 ABC transporter substrate-binding protein [Arthrobacter hankyongi]